MFSPCSMDAISLDALAPAALVTRVQIFDACPDGVAGACSAVLVAFAGSPFCSWHSSFCGSPSRGAAAGYGPGFLSGTDLGSQPGALRIFPRSGARYTALCSGCFLGRRSAWRRQFSQRGLPGLVVFGVLKILILEFHPVGRAPRPPGELLRNLVELLAAIPSVVYGFWGLFVVIPMIRPAPPGCMPTWDGCRFSAPTLPAPACSRPSWSFHHGHANRYRHQP